MKNPVLRLLVGQPEALRKKKNFEKVRDRTFIFSCSVSLDSLPGGHLNALENSFFSHEDGSTSKTDLSLSLCLYKTPGVLRPYKHAYLGIYVYLSLSWDVFVYSVDVHR